MNSNEIEHQLEYCKMQLVALNNMLWERDKEKLDLIQRLQSAEDRASECDSLRLQLAETEAQFNSITEQNRQLQQELNDARLTIEQLTSSNREIDEELSLCGRDKSDLAGILRMMRIRQFNSNSERTKALNGKMSPENEAQIQELISSIMHSEGWMPQDEAIEAEIPESTGKPVPAKAAGAATDDEKGKCAIPKSANSGMSKDASHQSCTKKRQQRRQYTCADIEEMGFDTSCLPEGAKLVKGANNVWHIRQIVYIPGRFKVIDYPIGMFRAPGLIDPIPSGRPKELLPGSFLTPSFAAKYIGDKIASNRSEGIFLEEMRSDGADLKQQTLNGGMHRLISKIKDKMLPLIKDEVRKSSSTQNDETHLTVRSKDPDTGKLKYNDEWVHGIRAMDVGLVLFLYSEGSRSHEVQEEIFRGSSIRSFTADRLSIYPKIVKDLGDMKIEIARQADWIHYRRGLVNACAIDPRLKKGVEDVNMLIRIDACFKGMSAGERLSMRRKHCAKLVDAIFAWARSIRASKDYSPVVHKAMDYLLEDEEAFKQFLSHGELELENNAAERMFRHIALGRRNWLHSGSHEAAENITFLYCLYESCNMNGMNFRKYIAGLLAEIEDKGWDNVDYLAMLPRKTQGKDVKKSIA